MNSVLITGGEKPEYKYVENFIKSKYVCVADSGIEWVLENGINFDTLVGDMDSISDKDILKSLPKEKIIILPEDKDDTDTLFGLKYIKNNNLGKVTLIGGGGGRLDHLLGIYSLFDSDLSPDIWITKREIIYKVKGLFNIDGMAQKNISIFPLDKDVCSISSNGLKWELSMVDWKYRSIGISNLIIKDNAWIDTGDSNVLLILPVIGNKFE